MRTGDPGPRYGQEGGRMKTIILAAALAVQPGTYHGAGKDFGRGYTVTKQGEIRGTGKDFGKGWIPDGRGGYRGTGKNWGQRWTR